MQNPHEPRPHPDAGDGGPSPGRLSTAPPSILRAARLAELAATCLGMPAAFVDPGGGEGAIAVGEPPFDVDDILALWEPPPGQAGPATMQIGGASVVAMPVTLGGRKVWLGAVDPATHPSAGTLHAVHGLLTEMEKDGRAQRAATHLWTRRLEDENRRMARALRLVGAGTLVYDARAGTIEASSAACEILGRTDMETLEDFVMSFDPFDRSAVQRAMTGAEPTAASFDIHREILLADGSRKVVRLHGEAERESGTLLRTVATLQDVTAERVRCAEMRRLAETDPLTGLANRTVLDKALREAAHLADAERLHAGLLLVDLDDFRGINDTLGHTAGDEVLKFAARALASATRASDTVMRLGADQFAVVVTRAADPDGLAVIAERIATALDTRLQVQEATVRISASVGIAVYPEDVTPALDLNRAADEALTAAKADARGTVRRFDKTLWTRKETRRSIVARVREGLARSEFVAFFQPKLQLTTGSLVGFEALCRWRHPDLGVVGPSAFFAAFEDEEVGGPLSDVALYGAFRAARLFRERDMPFGHIAINLNRAQLIRDGLVDEVSRLQEQNGVGADEIVFEVLENVLIREHRNVYGNLSELSRLGFRVALDDFGTGFASLAHIREPFIKEVKIDRSFVTDAAANAGDLQIVAAIVQMARKLGLSTVAEGIEDEETVRYLTALGCAAGQGFAFAPALSFEDAMEFMRRQARIAALLEHQPPRDDAG